MPLPKMPHLDDFEGVFRALPQNGNADADMVLKLGVVDTDLTSLFSVELGAPGTLGGGKLDVGSLEHTFGSLTLGTDVMAAGTYDELSDFTASQQAYLIGWDEGNTSITVIPEPATLGLVAAFGAGALFVRRRFMI